MLHRKLDQFADRYCPVTRQFGLSHHWSLALGLKLKQLYIIPALSPEPAH
jgi:hypothetical protein